MMKEEDQTPPSSLQNGFVNLAFSDSEQDARVRVDVPSGGVKNLPSQISTPEVISDSIRSESCGWLCFKPLVLQRFRTGKWVLFWMCWAAAVQGIVINGFVNVSITTIEKRYNMKSTSTGLIAGCYDIGAVLCSIPVSYLGSLPGASKPRWLGWGLLIMGLGSFTFALPRFAAPYYHQLNLSNEENATSEALICFKNATLVTLDCEENADKWLSNFRYVFLFGQFLHGVGASPIYTLGVAYLDESVPLKMSSFYLGIFHAMAVLGPAIGYVLGGRFLAIYIDSPSIDPSEFGIIHGSDQWLGAWWVGFVLSGCLACSISWIVMAFPADIPGAEDRFKERLNASSEITSPKFSRIRDLPRASKVLFKNLSFVCIGLAEASEGILMSGLATFVPKVMESQFSLSAGNASILVGLIAVPAGGGGTFFGGWLVKKLKLQCEGVLKFCFVLSLCSFFVCIGFVMSCPNISFAGVNESYDNLSSLESIQLESSCNKGCHCNDLNFDPICGSNKLVYFSPCHAGCKSAKIVNGLKVFSNCDCIANSGRDNLLDASVIFDKENISIPKVFAIRQKCPSDCKLMEIFLVNFFLVMLLTFVITMPTVTGTLRCVPDTYRSYAMGVKGIIIRLLGTIPGPILFGYIIDRTCVLWQETCDVKGACRSYDNPKLVRSVMAACLVFKTGSTIFYFLSWTFFKRRKLYLESRNSSVQFGNKVEDNSKLDDAKIS